VADRVEDLDRN